MPYNPIANSIGQTDIDNLNTMAQDLITAIQALNTTNTALTTDERSNGVTIGKERKPFSDYYYANQGNYPTLKPAQTVVPEATAVKHFFIQDKFTALIGSLFTAIELLQDIQLNSEHYAFDYASEGRLAAKKGKINGIPGADSFFDALDALFPKTGPKPKPESIP